MLHLPLAACFLVPSPAALVGDPCVEGRWEPPRTHDLAGFTSPPTSGAFIAVHMALIPTGPHRGEVLVWDYEYEQSGPTWVQRWSIIDPRTPGALHYTNAELVMPDDGGDLFCAGFAWTAAGELFVAGGTLRYGTGSHHVGTTSFLGGVLTYLYDPADGPLGAWHRQRDLEIPRWYPTVTQLANDQMLVLGGIRDTNGHTTNDYQAFDPATGSWQMNGGSQVFPGPPSSGSELKIYPRMHLLSTGEIVTAGMSGRASKLNHLLAPGAWTTMDRQSIDFRDYGSAVLAPASYGRDVVLALAGYGYLDGNPQGFETSVELCHAGESGAPAWSWQPLDPLHVGRTTANAVLLPDGSVFVFGGEVEPERAGVPEFTTASELLDPETRTWTLAAPRNSYADYHSTAVLLPDGRVLTGGGEHRTWDYQVYVPPYLACGLPRPELLDAPAVLRYRATTPGSYRLEHRPLPAGQRVARAVLMRPGATTHHSGMSQRHVELRTVGYRTPTTIDVEAPLDANEAPPGHYMLFLLTAEGVPSVARWVELR